MIPLSSAAAFSSLPEFSKLLAEAALPGVGFPVAAWSPERHPRSANADAFAVELVRFRAARSVAFDFHLHMYGLI